MQVKEKIAGENNVLKMGAGKVKKGRRGGEKSKQPGASGDFGTWTAGRK